MSAIVWSTTLSAIGSELVGLTGVLAETGQTLHTRLASVGSEYDTRYPAAAGAKNTWLLHAAAAWSAALAAAQHVEGLIGDAGPSLTLDEYDATPLIARCTAAAKGAPTAFLVRMMTQHAAELRALWASESTGGEALYRRQFGTARPVRALELEIVSIIASATDWLAIVAALP